MFPELYSKPYKQDFSARTEEATLYSHYEKYYNEDQGIYCEFCDKELDVDEDCDCEDALDEKSEFPKLSQVTLQTILDLLPKGVKPSDVKISIDLDLGGMGVNGQSVSFTYSKTFKADPKGFKAASEQYEKNYQAYLVEKEKYDEWKRQEEIKELEVKLAKAKNKKKA